ncbi:MAG: class I mannose-6-phosphate isomerase [Verrucomicrobia bacterium]|nr:class I mannose-6-phosphate isomerase [Verrucomicrobiota bacterium]
MLPCPLTFQPIFKERVWGGRRLEQLYAKPLPPGAPIGESWEITDRPEGVSVIANGPLAGKTLRWLMENHREELLGSAQPCGGRFPLLVKLLDAREKLSLQVHPPPDKAAELGGEPKSEMWYVADAATDADIFTGLRRGVTRADFERKIRDGTVAECFHRHVIRRGDAMFLPSGRVHALGAGSVIFEIQQNSDTTYRVFDWNRVGLDGRPRELHIAPALAAIDFADFEPPLLDAALPGNTDFASTTLVDHALFHVSLNRCAGGTNRAIARGLAVIGVVSGEASIRANDQTVTLRGGNFCVLPACLAETQLTAGTETTFLLARPR